MDSRAVQGTTSERGLQDERGGMGIGMHEWLAVEDVSDEMLQRFMDTVGGDFTDKADLIRAMGVYHGPKHMRPDFDARTFVKDAYAIVEADQTPDKQRIAELEAKLARATLEMEKAKVGRPRHSLTRR